MFKIGYLWEVISECTILIDRGRKKMCKCLMRKYSLLDARDLSYLDL